MPFSASLGSSAFYLHRKIFDFPHSIKKGSDGNPRFPYIVSETKLHATVHSQSVIFYNLCMKLQLLTLLLFFTSLAKAQFSFEPNTDSSYFETAYDTTALFQYKFLEANAQLYSTYLELSYNTDSTWSYKRVLISLIDDYRIELPAIEPAIDIEKLWNGLVEVGFLELIPEQEQTVIIGNKGKMVDVPFEKYEQMWNANVPLFISEFASKNGIRRIAHLSPIHINEKLQQSEKNWFIPEVYRASFCYSMIKDTFQYSDYNEAFKPYFLELRKENSEKQSKRKKRR